MINDNYYYVNLDMADILGELVDLLNEKRLKIIGHDLIKDYYALMYKGFTAPDTEFDTAIAQYVIDPTKSNYNMKTLAFENLHYELKDEKEFMEESGQIDLLGGSTSKYIDYGFDWCLAVKRLMLLQQKKTFADNQLERVFKQVELPSDRSAGVHGS